MAGERTASWPFAFLQGALASIAALPGRNIRITVLLCVVAIGGSFAAAGALQMRFDRVQAYRQAAYFETSRARAIAAVAQASLARYEHFARLYADGQTTNLALAPAWRGIAVADSGGQILHADGEAIDMQSLGELARRGRVVLGAGRLMVIAFVDGADTVAVSFDTAALVPPAPAPRRRTIRPRYRRRPQTR